MKSHMLLQFLAVLLGFALANPSFAISFVFENVDHPASSFPSFSQATGVNNAGHIVGSYQVDSPTLTYTTSFIRDDSGYSDIIYPGAIDTHAAAINNAGIIVGSYWDGFSTGQRAFVYDEIGYTPFDRPGATRTNLFDINDTGLMIGSSYDGIRQTNFVYDGTGFTTIDHPDTDSDSDSTRLTAINDSGWIVGEFSDSNSTDLISFLYDGSAFTTFEFPGAFETILTGISNRGHIIGTFYSNSMDYLSGLGQAFLFDGTQFSVINHPDADLTGLSDINDIDQIVGSTFDLDQMVGHSFLASPVPLPSAVWLFFSGLIAVASLAKRRATPE
jgi:uncharacterized membrane protein